MAEQALSLNPRIRPLPYPHSPSKKKRNMNIGATPLTASQLLAQSTALEAVTAELANEPDAKAQNRAQIAALSDCADGPQKAEHIRGLVAATVAQISVHANSITRENAARWQTWALGLADGLEQSSLAPSAL